MGLSPSSGGPPSRRSRERRAYQIVLVGSTAGVIAVVGFILAAVGVMGFVLGMALPRASLMHRFS